MTAIINSAHVDFGGFYTVLQQAGCGDLSQHPFAETVFKSYAGGEASTLNLGTVLAARILFSTFAENSPVAGYDREQWRNLIKTIHQNESNSMRYQTVRTRMAVLESGPAGPSGVPFESMLGEDALGSWRKQCTGMEKAHALQQIAGANKSQIWDRYLEHVDPDELFTRWDVTDKGHISHSDHVMFLGAVAIFQATFAEFAEDGAVTLPLNTLLLAMKALNFGDMPRMFPTNALFSRFKDQQGKLEDVDCWEFITGCARMVRPVSVRADAMALPGWPGLPCMHGEESPTVLADLSAYLDTLQTGDMIVMCLMDETARYFNFLTNCLWTHVGIVINHKRGTRPGTPNLETECLLQKNKFRWKTQRFCTPSYCKCFATDEPDKPVVELFEATGAGIHVYDMMVRMFTGINAQKIGTLAVRRLKNAPGRDNEKEIENFIRQTRGHLYHVSNDDGFESQFCSQLSTAFLRHMGWVSPDARPDYEYTPDHFAKGSVPLGGGAEWGELEVIRNQWTSLPLPLKVTIGKDAELFSAVSAR